MINNKEEQPIAYYMERFRALTVEEITARCGICAEGSVLKFHFLGTKYTVTHPDFTVRAQTETSYDPLQENHAKILLLHFLTEGHAGEPQGRFVTYHDVPWGEVYYHNFEGRCIKRLAFSFGTRLDVFAKACEMLGGAKLTDGDISYEIPFLENLSLRLILWEADDEFPPSAQILFSDNFSLAFTAEDMAAVGDVTIDKLKKMK